MRQEAHFVKSLCFQGEWVDDVIFAKCSPAKLCNFMAESKQMGNHSYRWTLQISHELAGLGLPWQAQRTTIDPS